MIQRSFPIKSTVSLPHKQFYPTLKSTTPAVPTPSVITVEDLTQLCYGDDEMLNFNNAYLEDLRLLEVFRAVSSHTDGVYFERVVWYFEEDGMVL